VKNRPTPRLLHALIKPTHCKSLIDDYAKEKKFDDLRLTEGDLKQSLIVCLLPRLFVESKEQD
jgi:hypothetical protein